MARHTFRMFLFAVVLLWSVGCSSFHREWRKAGNSPPGDIRGKWEGVWLSEASGHSGRLRCLLTPISENKYEARFHAKYKKVLSFGYTATFEGEHRGDAFFFTGEADLGRLAGGVYSYEGTVNPTNFFSTYKSKYDHGTFQLQRPE